MSLDDAYFIRPRAFERAIERFIRDMSRKTSCSLENSSRGAKLRAFIALIM
jgi:hypothetical protein